MKARRARAEAAVDRLLAVAERLIAEIDAIEGDPDLEDEEADGPGDEDDEAWLSVSEDVDQGRSWREAGKHEARAPAEEGREFDEADHETQIDDEPIDWNELESDELEREGDDTGDDLGTPDGPVTEGDQRARDDARAFLRQHGACGVGGPHHVRPYGAFF